MPPRRNRQTKEPARAVHHPYKLRSLRNPTRLEATVQDQLAEKIKYQKALREQALQIFDKKELRKFPVEQLRRFATIKRVHGRRKQSIMLSFKRVYGECVPLYPSEGRVEMREYSREEYQIGKKKVTRIGTFQEVILKEEEVEDFSILKDAPCLRRSSRLKDRPQPVEVRLAVHVKPSSKIGRRQG